jgi:hypothetical protein
MVAASPGLVTSGCGGFDAFGYGPEACSARLKGNDEIEDMRATLDKSAKLALTAVRAERAAIVAFIDRHKKQRVEADSLWDEGYEAALDNIAAAIKATGET